MRFRNLAIFAALLALAVIDIADDVAEGVELGHAWIEGAMIVGSLAGIAYELARLRRRAAALEARGAELSRSVDALRQESDAWRAEARALAAGVSIAIDRQLERWGLSEAEKETALLLLKGLSHKEIADVRGVGEASARQQARALYKKANLTGRHELAAFFLEDLLVAGGEQRRTRSPTAA